MSVPSWGFRSERVGPAARRPGGLPVQETPDTPAKPWIALNERDPGRAGLWDGREADVPEAEVDPGTPGSTIILQ